MVIYPEGIWYGGVTPEKLHRIIEEHLLQNTPIREWIVRVTGNSAPLRLP